MVTRVAVEEESNDKGRKSSGNGDKEGNGNGKREDDCLLEQWRNGEQQ
jgi:hypothetical protein